MNAVKDFEKSILKMKRTINKKEDENKSLREDVRRLRDELCDVKSAYSDHVKSTAELREAVNRLSAEKSKWMRRKD